MKTREKIIFRYTTSMYFLVYLEVRAFAFEGLLVVTGWIYNCDLNNSKFCLIIYYLWRGR